MKIKMILILSLMYSLGCFASEDYTMFRLRDICDVSSSTIKYMEESPNESSSFLCANVGEIKGHTIHLNPSIEENVVLLKVFGKLGLIDRVQKLQSISWQLFYSCLDESVGSKSWYNYVNKEIREANKISSELLIQL